MLSLLVAFLAVLNPFALFIYLQPVMEELDHRRFLHVLFRASMISFFVYCFFALSGIFIFEYIFHVHFESFRIFGGLVVFSFAYLLIIKGQTALLHMKEDLDDLASEIALPFMVGAATISIVVMIGNSSKPYISVIAILFVMAVNFLIVVTLKAIRDRISRTRFKIAFDKNMGIILRLNAFFVGAIGVNMVITGINNLYFS